jgi:outer membrane protein OmpA-like peptidoglycan-associated protein
MGKSNEKKRDFFWLSYSDLMTSLFFVMLTLFVLVYSMQNKLIQDIKDNNADLTAIKDSLQNTNDSLLVAKKELERIREIEKTVNNIDSRYFQYDATNKKHILNMQFRYPREVADIRRIIPDKRPDLLKAGQAIKNLIEHFPEEDNIKYLVVVEGQASNDGWKGNDDLSYHRAQSLVNFWKANKVGLDKLKNCEIIVAGSGIKGVPRELPDIPPANQRFLITIIPRIGEMKK